MENGQASNKRARPHAVVVKQERVERKASQEGKGQGAPVAVEAPMQAAQWTRAVVEMDLIFYHCFACQRPLKPPAHECEGGHVVCGGCHGDRCCTACDPPTAYRPSRSRDAAIHAIRVPCQHEADGCERKLMYYHHGDHVLQCAYAPTFCPEHGCPVWASAPKLVDHIAAAHSWPVTEVSYGSPCTLTVPRRGNHLLVEKHDRRLFAVTLFASGEDTVVSVVCVRESSLAVSVPGFVSKVWADVASNSKLHVFMQSIVASSNLFPGGQQPVCLKVPPGFGNDGEDLVLGVRIEEL